MSKTTTRSNNARPEIAPAPWRRGKEFKPGQYGLQDAIAISVQGEVIAHVNCGFNRGEVHADLIVLAPELLAALIKARKLIDALMPGLPKISVQDYRAVNETPIEIDRLLARVEGGQ